MSKRFPSQIVVDRIPDDSIDDFGLALIQDGIVGRPEEFLCQNGTYRICDDQAVGGYFPNTERWLRKKDISYDIAHEGAEGVLPERCVFRSGQRFACLYVVDHNGNVMLTEDEIRDYAKSCDDLDDFMCQLGDFFGRSIKPLSASFLVRGAMPADELKKKNTDPSATACARCGRSLKDPMGIPSLKHCPICEP